MYTLLQEDGNCKEPECTGNNFLTWKGECKPCPEFKYVVNKKSCEAPSCGINERLTKEGLCEKCGPY